MPVFEQFQYKECLPKRSLEALPGFLIVRPKQSDDVILLRLLCGTLDLQNTTFNTLFTQRINYTKTDFILNSRISAKTILDVFKSDNVSIESAEAHYVNSFKFGNRTLFKNLLLELSNYFYQKEKNSHATGFLHLYRAIELVSYCFPLYYASKSTSYEKTYSSLKNFFTKVEGELNFFKKFVNDHLFKNDPAVLDVQLSIKIFAPNADLQEQYFKALKKLCDNNPKNIELKGYTPNSEIIISRRGLTSLIYDLRNRYYHLLTGDFNDNFSSGDLAEIDCFYEVVNDTILNWLTLIYIEILANTIEPATMTRST